jgi:hypothetical protein
VEEPATLIPIDNIQQSGNKMATQFDTLTREQLLDVLGDFARNWLAHDGLWFQAVESSSNMDHAIELDTQAWEQFTVIEAQRIMKRHNIAFRSGLDGLKRALGFRLYALLNTQEIRNETATSFDFFMVDCRVQSARRRKGLALFPCKSVGIVEYSGFAKTIDDRIVTECICCPPDQQAGRDYFCGWRFSLSD